MGNLTLNGATSGQITLAPTAVAGTNTITLPAATGTLLTTAGGQTISGTVTLSTLTSPAATALTIQSAGTTAMTIDTSQNVGIGTTSPAFKLDVNSNANINGTAVMSSPYTMRNKIINGAMVIDQRNNGASVTPVADQYLVDRFNVYLSQSSKFSAQQNAGSVTPPSGFTNYLGLTVAAAANVTVGAGDYFGTRQMIEGFNVADLGWGSSGALTVTLSFWVRCSLTGTMGGSLTNSSRSYPFTFTVNAANTWEYKTITVSGDTSGTWNKTNGIGIEVRFSLGGGSSFAGTAGVWAAGNFVTATGATNIISTNSATFYITGVQLERGTVATPFEYRNYQQELAMCQRYYIRYNAPAGGGNLASSIVLGRTATRCDMIIAFPVFLRAAPTTIETTGLATDYAVIIGSSSFTSSAIPAYNGSTVNNMELVLTFASGITAGSAGKLVSGANASYLGFSAELI